MFWVLNFQIVWRLNQFGLVARLHRRRRLVQIRIALPRRKLFFLRHCFPKLVRRHHNPLPIWRVGLRDETAPLRQFVCVEYLSFIIAGLWVVHHICRRSWTKTDFGTGLIHLFKTAFTLLHVQACATFFGAHGVVWRETVTFLVDSVDEESIVGASSLCLFLAFRRLLLEYFVLVVIVSWLVLGQSMHVNLIYGPQLRWLWLEPTSRIWFLQFFVHNCWGYCWCRKLATGGRLSIIREVWGTARSSCAEEVTGGLWPHNRWRPCIVLFSANHDPFILFEMRA